MQGEIKPKSDLTSINAPAHPYATDAVVYTALFLYKDQQQFFYP